MISYYWNIVAIGQQTFFRKVEKRFVKKSPTKFLLLSTSTISNDDCELNNEVSVKMSGVGVGIGRPVS